MREEKRKRDAVRVNLRANDLALFFAYFIPSIVERGENYEKDYNSNSYRSNSIITD